MINRERMPKTIPKFLRFILQKTLAQGKWWLLPLWIVLAILGILLILSGNSYLLPAIYIAF
jgi:hypothetical protein